MPKIVTFGEIMLRLSPENGSRLFQSDRLESSFGGAEANTAIALRQLGIDAAFVTKLPESPVGDAVLQTLRSFAIDQSAIKRGGERLGIYFLEPGASIRSSKCIYDRKGSSLSQAKPDDFDWNSILEGADLFHFTGITPALGEHLPDICLAACRTAKAKGIKISFDPNYRSALWSMEKASKILSAYLPFVDILFTGGDLLSDLFDCKAETEIEAARSLMKRTGISTVILTSRVSHSANDNDISAALITCTSVFSTPVISLHIVDRVGAGDAFAAGVLYGILTEKDAQTSLDLGICLSALKHTIKGDYVRTTLPELLSLVNGNRDGRIRR